MEKADDLNASQKKTALTRLRVLKMIESPKDGPGIDDLVEPDVITVVYMGGPHMGRSRMSPILVSFFSALMMPSKKHGTFQRVVAVDEINLLDEDAWRMFLRAARLARHLGLMGQDLMCVPDEMFGVAGICAVFRQSSPQVWEQQRQRIGGLQGYRWGDVGSLPMAEAIVTSLESTDGQMARRVRFRPPLCMHGGYTRGRSEDRGSRQAQNAAKLPLTPAYARGLM